MMYAVKDILCAHDMRCNTYTFAYNYPLSSQNKIYINQQHIKSYGLAGLKNVPNGYSALAEIYGRGANRTPLLVAFGFPLDWVVTLPSQDVNGEDGTIQAGEYAKGDTATFFVVPNESKVEVCYLLFNSSILCIH